MSLQDRIEQLEQAGIIKNAGDLSPEARQVIRDMSDDEFNCLLSVRQKLSEEGRKALDHIVPYFGF